MWFVLIVISASLIAVVVLFLYFVSDSRKSGIHLDLWTCLTFVPAIIFFSFLLGIVVGAMTTPTIEDYIHGNVKVTIEQTIKNGEIIKQDTVYRKL